MQRGIRGLGFALTLTATLALAGDALAVQRDGGPVVRRFPSIIQRIINWLQDTVDPPDNKLSIPPG